MRLFRRHRKEKPASPQEESGVKEEIQAGDQIVLSAGESPGEPSGSQDVPPNLEDAGIREATEPAEISKGISADASKTVKAESRDDAAAAVIKEEKQTDRSGKSIAEEMADIVEKKAKAEHVISATAAEPPGTMVLVEGGSFVMGSEGGVSDEKPVHTVILDDFCMGKYQVTVGEFREFVEETGFQTAAEKEGGAFVWSGMEYARKPDASWRNPYFEQTDEQPVVCVSWYDAIEYCNWKGRKQGLTPCLILNGKDTVCDWNKDGFRLPTEAEWEYAARGGKASLGFTYSGGNDLDKVAWYSVNSGRRTHPVGRKAPNEIGLHDMSGNAVEWCWDWYDAGYYAKGPMENPRGPVSGQNRVVRGGSWNLIAWNCRSTLRFRLLPEGRYDFWGFRICRKK